MGCKIAVGFGDVGEKRVLVIWIWFGFGIEMTFGDNYGLGLRV